MSLTFDQKIKLLKKNKIFTIHKDSMGLFPSCLIKESGCIQILVETVVKQPKRKKYQLIGKRFNSPEFESMEELINIIDWDDYLDRSEFCK